MKRITLHLICFAAILSIAAGCAVNRLSKMSLSSAKIERIVPQGFTAIGIVASASVTNPGKPVEIKGIEGSIFLKENKIGTFSANDVQIASGQNSTAVDIILKLDSAMSAFTLLANIQDLKPEDISVSASARLCNRPGAKGTPVTIEKKKLVDLARIGF